MSKFNKIWAVFMICMGLFVLYFGTSLLIMENGKELTHIPAENLTHLTYTIDSDLPSNREIKNNIDKLYDNPLYIYADTGTLRNGMLGLCQPSIRLILINDSIVGYDYAMALAHELTHLTEFTSNEIYVQYKTFTTLYESGNEFLVTTAKIMYNDMIHGGFSGYYDAAYYINEYLQNA